MCVCICTQNVCLKCACVIFNVAEWQQISVELSEVNETESWRAFCMPCHVSVCTHLYVCEGKRVCVTCMCICLPVTASASAHPVEALHARPFSPRSPWGAVSLPVGLGFPCVTMITFTSTIKSRRAQITVTHGGNPPPHLWTSDEIWWQDLLSSAQP